MSSKRTTVLMLVLLLLLLGYVSRPYWYLVLPDGPAVRTDLPLPGSNTVSGLEVRRDASGRWWAGFDYFYTGNPGAAILDIRVSSGFAASEPPSPAQGAGWVAAERGQHHVSREILRPMISRDAFASRKVSVQFHDNFRTLATAEVSQLIEWPDARTWAVDRELADKKPAEVFARAVALIDRGDGHSLDDARRMIERLIRQDANFDPGYVELARIAMKSNWGPQGLHQAEGLLASALAIRPENTDAKILLGYVYAHQGRYKQAEALFDESSRTATKNLWLWANWGEALALQGKIDPGIGKYRRALAVPPTHDTYDRARLDAYAHLLRLLEGKNDLDGMDALFRQRVEDYGQASCYGAEHANFALRKRGDADRAIALARQAIEGQCGQDATQALGMAQYVAWAAAPEATRAQLLNEARVHRPVSPGLLYELASSDRTISTVKQLIAAGESIGQRDNDKLDALAHALQREDHAAARRLLKLGARPDASVGPGDLPIAFMPVLSGDVEGVRLLRQFGVDYARLAYRGRTAVDIARELGDRRVLDAMGVADQKNRL